MSRKSLTDQLAEAHQRIRLLEKAQKLPAKITRQRLGAPSRAAKAKPTTWLAMLSDIHHGEVVRKAELGGYNEYNAEICEARLRAFFHNVLHLTEKYISGMSYSDAVLILGGDMVSGEHHEELARTNDRAVLESALVLSEIWAEGLRLWARETRLPFHVVAVPGNHGRMDHRPAFKRSAARNYDTLAYQMLARILRGATWAKRITLDIPPDGVGHFRAQRLRCCVTHGDKPIFRGGSGITGTLLPITRGFYKLQAMESAIGRPFDKLFLGHFHTYRDTGLVAVNGSIKGFDEYARGMGFSPEPPQQTFMCIDAEHGATIRAPIHLG